jgi:hypothetical protein
VSSNNSVDVIETGIDFKDGIEGLAFVAPSDLEHVEDDVSVCGEDCEQASVVVIATVGERREYLPLCDFHRRAVASYCLGGGSA